VTDFSKSEISKQLQRAFEPVDGSGADAGWGCVANLVRFWLNNPDKAPKNELTAVTEPKLVVIYDVVAYSGEHGDIASRRFRDREEALAYTKKLDSSYEATVTKYVTIEPIMTKIYDAKDAV
jgi:hypothetical protein